MDCMVSSLWVTENALMMLVLKEDWRDRLETAVRQVTAGCHLQNMFSKCLLTPTWRARFVEDVTWAMFFKTWNVQTGFWTFLSFNCFSSSTGFNVLNFLFSSDVVLTVRIHELCESQCYMCHCCCTCQKFEFHVCRPADWSFWDGLLFSFCTILSSSSCLGVLKLRAVLHNLDYYSSLFTNLHYF